MTPKIKKKRQLVKNSRQKPRNTGDKLPSSNRKVYPAHPKTQNRHKNTIGSVNSSERSKNTYIIWGQHTVFSAIMNPNRKIKRIYANERGSRKLFAHMAKLTPERRLEIPKILPLNLNQFDGIENSDEKMVHQGVAAAVLPLKSPPLKHLLTRISGERLLLLLLDQLSDARNVGAIIRSAHAFGVSAVITTDRNSALENGTMARAACGALDSVPLIRVVNLSHAMEQIKKYGIMIVGLTADGNASLQALNNHKNLAIVLGAEGAGLRQLTRRKCDILTKIEINPNCESLNVSNAAAIALHSVRVVNK